MFEITKLRFPVQPNALPDTASTGWLPVIAGLTNREIKDFLRRRWSSFQEPYLQALAAAVLERDLVNLSIDAEGRQWLSFEDAASALHIAPPSALPNDLRSRFPFHHVRGLADFAENFGALANWTLPPCPWFVPVKECRVVASDCDYYDWGMVGKWAGSLTLYNSGTGNFIVLSPDNCCAKWDHDIGWGHDDEDPFHSLSWSMSELVEAFVAYLSLGQGEAKSSPFYY